MNKLTIAIPTFNRNKQLLSTVEALLPQLTEGVAVKVFDNGSPAPVAEDLKKYVAHNIEIVRSDTNIGAAGNIIKCFEYCSSDWLWVLGDDDAPSDNAVEVILATIGRYPEVVFIKFDSNLCQYGGYYPQDVVNTGQNELIDNLKSFPNLLFMSSGVYRIAEIRKSLKNAYYFTSTFSPQVAFVLDYVRTHSTAKTLFASTAIVEWKVPLEGHKWGDEVINKAIHELVYLVSDERARAQLYNKIIPYHQYNSLPGKQTFISYILADTTERKYLVADFFASQSFMHWSANSTPIKLLVNFAGMATLMLLTTIKPVGVIAKYLFRNHPKANRSIYNRFLVSTKETRL